MKWAILHVQNQRCHNVTVQGISLVRFKYLLVQVIGPSCGNLSIVFYCIGIDRWTEHCNFLSRRYLPFLVTLTTIKSAIAQIKHFRLNVVT